MLAGAARREPAIHPKVSRTTLTTLLQVGRQTGRSLGWLGIDQHTAQLVGLGKQTTSTFQG